MKYFFTENEANIRELGPGVKLKTMWGEKIMMSLVELKPNSVVPMHSHPNEQGEFLFEIGNESKVVKAGEYYIIPGGVDHSVQAGNEPSKALDIFSPPREDYKS